MRNKNTNPDVEAFAARLRLAMKQAGFKLSATQLADAFILRYWGEGITSHAARNWMTGVSIPKSEKLKTLSEILQITPQDLFFGPDKNALPDKNSSHHRPLSMGDALMLRQFLRLNPVHQRIIRHMVMVTLAFERDGPKPPPTDTNENDSTC